MKEALMNIGFIVLFLIIIGLFILSIFLVVNGIKGRHEEPSGKDVLFGKSSNGHDRPQALSSESIQNNDPSKGMGES
jgi:hypothetical protein